MSTFCNQLLSYSSAMSTTTDGKAQRLLFRIEDMVNQGPSFVLQCHAWATVSEVKKDLEKILKVMHSNLRLFYKNVELTKNGISLLDYDLKPNDTLTVKITPQLENSLGIINQYQLFDSTPDSIISMVEQIKSGFLKGLKPKLTENGTSGSYFLQNHNMKPVAIFKPYDEEPFAPNNPRKYVGELGSQGFRKGILSGQSAARQVAAFMIDSTQNFHGVPPTTYIEFYHPSFAANQSLQTVPIKSTRQFKLKNQQKTKHGSLQSFIPHDDTIGNFGANCFSVEQVHKIAMLDIRILNCDRNDTNILVKKQNIKIDTLNGTKIKKQFKLIPIDHGLSFPDNFQIYDYEVLWIDFPQTIQPFTEKQLKFIENINPAQDCQNLRSRLEFRPICLRNFRIASILLKQAAKIGMTLYDIAQIMYRRQPQSDDSDRESPRVMMKKNSLILSELQKLVIQAQNIYNVVKKNGLKSSIYYQIGIIHPRNNINKKTSLSSIKEEEDQEDQNKRTSIMHTDHVFEKPSKRGISLPTLKPTICELQQKQQKQLLLLRQISSRKDRPKRLKQVRKSSKDQQEEKQWQEVFFHYFQDILSRYLRSKQDKNMKRSRFRSECLS